MGGRGAREVGDIFGQDAVRGRGKGLLRAVRIWGWPESFAFPYHLMEKTQVNFSGQANTWCGHSVGQSPF